MGRTVGCLRLTTQVREPKRSVKRRPLAVVISAQFVAGTAHGHRSATPEPVSVVPEDGAELPWRSRPEPWRVMVSEFMLQQTQVKTVLPLRAIYAAIPKP